MKAFWFKRMRTFGRRLLREESGQSIAEYVLIMAIVLMLAMKVKGILKDKVGGMADSVGGKLEEFANDIE